MPTPTPGAPPVLGTSARVAVGCRRLHACTRVHEHTHAHTQRIAAAAVLPLSLVLSLPAAAEEAAGPMGMIVDEVARAKIMENATQVTQCQHL
jgi:hypothetical protein